MLLSGLFDRFPSRVWVMIHQQVHVLSIPLFFCDAPHVVVRRPREVSAAAFILLQVVMPHLTITRDETSTITVQSLHVSHLLGVLHVLLLSQFYTKALKKSVDVVSVSSGIRVASVILWGRRITSPSVV